MARTLSTFGALLKRYRLAAGLTQEGLAARAGLSAHAVSDLERHPARLPRLESVALLAKALALAPDQRATLLAAARPASDPASVPVPPRPPTRYARSGDVSIAYQVLGDGPVDLVAIPPFVSHVEWDWEEPRLARFLRRLASFARLIRFDKRGTGLSDRVPGVATLEARMDDIRAVMDDVGTARAVIMGDSEGGPLAALFAATYPERVAALILYGTSASDVGRSDYPWPPPYAARLRQIDDDARTIHRTWGTPEGARALLEHFAPSVADDAAFRRYFTTAMRLGASPGAVIALRRMNLDLDVRHILPAIRVPTLVLQRTGDRGTHPGEGRYLAARIPGARLVELPGDDHFAFVGDMEGLIATIAPFVVAAGATGVAGEGDEPDRVLTTVLAAAPTLPGVASVPPSLRERFGALARGECAGHGGRRVTVGATTLLATFDGPARAIRCARALVRGADGLGLALRVALHTGECDRCDDRARGPAVDVAAGLVGQAEPGMVLVSGVVKDLVAGSGLTFTAYSVQHLAGGPNIWPLYAVD